MSCLSLAHSALMTGHSTYMYFSVSIRVVHQQSWLVNGSWRLAHSLTNVLFGDASHHLLMTDCGSYMYFFGFTGLLLFVFRSLLMYSTIFSYEELYHETLSQGLVNHLDETHLLHSLEVEIVQLIHDLSHLLVHLLPS